MQPIRPVSLNQVEGYAYDALEGVAEKYVGTFGGSASDEDISVPVRDIKEPYRRFVDTLARGEPTIDTGTLRDATASAIEEIRAHDTGDGTLGAVEQERVRKSASQPTRVLFDLVIEQIQRSRDR